MNAQDQKPVYFSTLSCWTFPLLVAWTEKGLCALFPIVESEEKGSQDLAGYFPSRRLIKSERLPEWIEQVEYSVKHLDQPYRGPLDLNGTEFQKQVWQALLMIPAGETRSYTDIAKRINRPKAVRAVGSACGANPVAILVPCHRVIRRDGSFQGYHWGIDMKARLLTAEASLS